MYFVGATIPVATAGCSYQTEASSSCRAKTNSNCNENSGSLKKFLPDLIAIAAFILISFIYFVPAVFDGRVVVQHDSLAAIGQGQEQRDYMERHDGERTRWNLSMFSGMPSYQMSPTYDSSKPQDAVKKSILSSAQLRAVVIYHAARLLYIDEGIQSFAASKRVRCRNMGLFFILFILIAAGHIWKFVTLRVYPAHHRGYDLRVPGQVPSRGLLFTVFTAFQISSNHLQMTYYFLFVMFL